MAYSLRAIRPSLALLALTSLFPLAVHAGSAITDLPCIPAVEFAASSESGIASALGISTRQTRLASQARTLMAVYEPIAKLAGLHPPLAICLTPQLNAFVTKPTEPLRVFSGLLELIGDDRDMMAAVLGHELSHLSRGHHQQLLGQVSVIMAHGQAKARNVMRNSKDSNAAVSAGLTQIKLEVSAFQREQEIDADDFGTQLMSKAGFSPEGITRLAEAMFQRTQDQDANLMSDHPGWLERISRVEPRVQDEAYDQVAIKLLRQKEWDKLSYKVADWLNRMPQSGNGWYYKALILQKLRKENSVEAFENAFSARKPGISKLKEDFAPAWLSLCVGLYRQGYKYESANCARLIETDEMKERYQALTFGDQFFMVGGNQPQNLALRFSRDQSGNKLITDDLSMAQQSDSEGTMPPWKTIRFKQVSQIEAPRSTRVDMPTANRAAVDDVRSNCKPPLCLITN